MIRKGDKLIAKIDFLLDYDVPYDHREFNVIDCDVPYIKIENDEGRSFEGCYDMKKYFYLPTSINREIIELIDRDNIQFKSFQGVTEDGKIIQIEIG